MNGYKVTYSPASHKFTVTNLQTGRAHRIPRGWDNTTDNLYPMAVLTMLAWEGNTGVIHFIGSDKNFKYYVVDSEAF